jgi:S-adenosylmethionine:tRNA ribosyltransferase-isomerase
MIPKIALKDFTYELPEDKIANFPVKPRDSAKLLVFKDDNIQSQHFTDLADYMDSADLMVVNNTKVIPARIWFQSERNHSIQIFLLKPLSADFLSWEVIVGNRRKFKEGECLSKTIEDKSIKINWLDRELNTVKIELSNCEVFEALELFGEVPLPPYIKREIEQSDTADYQALFAQHEGAVAAPTASLHFTDNLIQSIANKGVKKAEVTLHVSAGTFKPVTAEYADEHEMHAERFVITTKLLNALLNGEGEVIAVGTKACRVLESIVVLGAKLCCGELDSIFVSSGDGYLSRYREINTREALLALRDFVESRGGELNGETQIFIVPGFEFRLVSKLITNFHQPNSTLLLLISALVGDRWKEIYEFALQENYRFLSYGDGSLLEGKKKIVLKSL